MAYTRVMDIARAVRGRGGRALLVGGYVRDRMRGAPSKDLDVEVFGLTLDDLQSLLGEFGEVITVGRSFGVLRVKGMDVDFSLPRRDSKVGAGHRGFDVETDPSLDFATAAKRRDLTINSIGLDPLTDEVLDPHGGVADLEAGVLRATDPTAFDEDPLRGLRVAQFAARMAMSADAQLEGLCARLDLSEVSPERIFDEMRKLLLKGVKPSLGFELMNKTGMLTIFPEVAAMSDVPQDPQYHPEGDVWIHTMMVIDAAVALKDGGIDDEGIDDEPLMFGALCHDFGKPSTTDRHPDGPRAGRVRSHGHEVAGIEPTRVFLQRMRAPTALERKVCALVEHHLAPAIYVRQKARDQAYRRLARKLEAADVTLELLERVARADHLGRTTPEAMAGQFEAGDRFLERARNLSVQRTAPADAVRGADLIALGHEPGPDLGKLLARCRDVQDETGWTDPKKIIESALGES